MDTLGALFVYPGCRSPRSVRAVATGRVPGLNVVCIRGSEAGRI
jgi:hypothetical protein